MVDDNDDLMRKLQVEARRMRAGLMKDEAYEELQLFEFYLKETGALLVKMHAEIDPQDDRAERYFERRIRYSHVIYLASLLETYLKRACGRLDEARPLAESDDAKNGRFRLSDLAGDKWDQPKRFLEVYLRFDFPGCWSTLRSLADVRNFLAHDNGSLEGVQYGKKREAKEAFFKNLGLQVHGLELVITDEFIASSLCAFRDFIEALDSRVDTELVRAERPAIVK